MRWFTSSQNGGNMTPGWYSNGIFKEWTQILLYTGNGYDHWKYFV